MTEAHWLNSTDRTSLIEFVDWMPKSRKWHLYGCACIRNIWALLADDRRRHAVEICERFADGFATQKKFSQAREAVYSTYRSVGDFVADHSALLLYELCVPLDRFDIFAVVCHAAEISAEASEESDLPGGARGWDALLDTEEGMQCHLLRDIFGNPFRAVTVAPTWLAWNDGTVPKIAHAIYHERTFDHMLILADALEDAGCDNADILAHCRSDGPHVRGCWVIDLLLGKP